MHNCYIRERMVESGIESKTAFPIIDAAEKYSFVVKTEIENKNFDDTVWLIIAPKKRFIDKLIYILEYIDIPTDLVRTSNKSVRIARRYSAIHKEQYKRLIEELKLIKPDIDKCKIEPMVVDPPSVLSKRTRNSDIESAENSSFMKIVGALSGRYDCNKRIKIH